jgi:nitrile hydratase
MAGDHAHASSRTHMTDFDGHLMAVQSDLEYYTRKRLEPRAFLLARRGIVPLAALLRSHAEASTAGFSRPRPPADDDVETAITALQERLDRLVLGIATSSIPIPGHPAAIDDLRHERGDYHPFLRLAKRPYAGTVQERLQQLGAGLDDAELVLAAFTQGLLELGHVTAEQLEQRRSGLAKLGYQNGARIVARAWTDPAFKERLLTQGRSAVRELDIPPGKLGILGVAENTAEVHNVVVCTLCSCYPSDVLGDPPWWYRTEEYRREIVIDPRSTLRDRFGLDIPPDVAVHVHDSTSDIRWMVLPRRPAGTDDMSEEELAALVTPESLVGTAVCRNTTAATGTAAR